MRSPYGRAVDTNKRAAVLLKRVRVKAAIAIARLVPVISSMREIYSLRLRDMSRRFYTNEFMKLRFVVSAAAGKGEME
jgi:hypothetical protein